MGYFDTYNLESQGKWRHTFGMSDDIKVKLGRIRDYELSGSEYLTNTLTASSLAFLTLMLLN